MDERSAALAKGIEEIAAETGGTVGVAARGLRSGLALDFNAHAVFPSASTIKFPIMMEVFAQVEAGTLRLDETLTLRDEDVVPGAGVLQELRPGREFTVEELMRLMIVISDNTASNMLIDRVTCESVNARLEGLGCTHTRLGRKFYDFEARDRGMENYACPAELAGLLSLLERRQLVSADASERMLVCLRRQQIAGKIPKLLPPDTPVAHKTGEITGASHDVGIIYSPAGPLVLAALTQGIAESAVAEGAIRHIARLLYRYWGEVG